MTIFQDLKYGLRMIAKAPGFTLLATLALALGVSANTTIFSLINGVLLRPLKGINDPARLVEIYTSDYSSGLYGTSSYPDYVDFRDQSDVFENLSAFSETVMNATGEAEAERLRGVIVTGNYFDMLGVGVKLGRTLHATDDQPASSQPVVISDSLWQRRFSSNQSAVGQTLNLNGKPYIIVGVTDGSFRGLRLGLRPEFWLPAATVADFTTSDRGDRGIELVGRLKPGVTLAQAQTQLKTIAVRLAQAYPATNLGTLDRPNEPRPVTVVQQSRIDPEGQQELWRISFPLFAVVGLVLLIACANVANLLLARASARRREIAVRLALGASGGRLLRQLLTESLLLALFGGVAGLIVTQWSSSVLPGFFPPEELAGLDLSTDWRVLVFTLVVTLITGLLFGLVPALQATRLNLIPSLKDDSRSYRQHLRRLGLRDVLVVAQLALSLTVLIGAGLFVRSLQHALRFDPGFAAQNLMTASLATRGANLSPAQGSAFYDEALQRIGSLPDVQSVTLTSVVPVSGGGERRGVQVEGYQPQAGEDTELNTNVIGSNYFRTMGIPIVAGRDFNTTDKEGSPRVLIVNEELARRYFGGAALGKRLRFGSNPTFSEIVGVARNAKHRSLRESPLPVIYIPLSQEYRGGMTLMVRTAGDPAGVVGAVRKEMRALNKDVPLFSVRTIPELIRDQLATDRMLAVLLSVFGAGGLLLASIGIYGVMGYAVAQRTHEIGIRMALGAERRDILKLIVRQGLVLILIGAGLGVALAFAGTRVLQSVLFGVSASDPLTFGSVVILLVGVALLACYLPARRATKVDPLVALRYE